MKDEKFEMTNNTFETFNIAHLSASSINLFITNPALWILRYLFGVKFEGNAATTRGTCTHQGIGYSLPIKGKKQKTQKQCIKLALKDYDNLIKYLKENNESLDESKIKAEREKLPRFLEVAIPFYKDLIDPKTPVLNEQKIELQLEELPIPIVGYLDLQLPHEDTVRDIKTVTRMPSSVSSAISRQMAVYAAATGATPIVDYVCVTKTKAEVVPMVVNDVEKHLEEVKRAAITIMNVLSYSNDINEIAKLYYPDLDDWKWTDRERELARQIWS